MNYFLLFCFRWENRDLLLTNGLHFATLYCDFPHFVTLPPFVTCNPPNMGTAFELNFLCVCFGQSGGEVAGSSGQNLPSETDPVAEIKVFFLSSTGSGTLEKLFMQGRCLGLFLTLQCSF